MSARSRDRFAAARHSLAAAARSGSLATLLVLATATLGAQPATDPTPLQFTDKAEEVRFHALVSELRCVMCQNQSLADSNAQIAVDLRKEVLALMRQGRNDREVKDFLVARYGEFVLYRPQVESKTWLLWFGPALVLLAGGLVVITAVRRHRAGAVVGGSDAAVAEGKGPAQSSAGSTDRTPSPTTDDDEQEW